MARMTRLALILALAAAPAWAAMPPRTLVIRDDPGGTIEARLDQIETLRATGRSVEIRGRCASSCTMLLAVACVAPIARLAFHGPGTQYPGVSLPPPEFDRVSRVMAAHYPPMIRAWFLRKARLVTGDVLTLTGAEAIRLGAKECK